MSRPSRSDPRPTHRGLAGYARRNPWWRSVPVAIFLLPFWLTSELRQANWQLAAKVGSIGLVWVTLLVIGASAAQRSDQETGGREAPVTSTPTTEPPFGTGQSTPIPVATATSVQPVTIARSGGLSLLEQLTIAPEGPRTGYDRGLFDHWIDADGDGCDTRREVLAAESLDAITEGGCSLVEGRWYSAYDGITTNDPSTFDVDHVVALAEAWDSGARAWTPSTRRDFANDLGYEGSLIAVSASSNRSKSDEDPAEWRPPLSSYWCEFAVAWVTVKVRWSLTADQTEVGALSELLGYCGQSQSATAPMWSPVPAPTAAPSAAPAPPPSGNCHPSYPDFCIPPPPPDLDCGDVSQKRFTVRHDVPDPDPHGFDGDNDGVGCES